MSHPSWKSSQSGAGGDDDFVVDEFGRTVPRSRVSAAEGGSRDDRNAARKRNRSSSRDRRGDHRSSGADDHARRGSGGGGGDGRHHHGHHRGRDREDRDQYRGDEHHERDSRGAREYGDYPDNRNTRTAAEPRGMSSRHQHEQQYDDADRGDRVSRPTATTTSGRAHSPPSHSRNERDHHERGGNNDSRRGGGGGGRTSPSFPSGTEAPHNNKLSSSSSSVSSRPLIVERRDKWSDVSGGAGGNRDNKSRHHHHVTGQRQPPAPRERPLDLGLLEGSSGSSSSSSSSSSGHGPSSTALSSSYHVVPELPAVMTLPLWLERKRNEGVIAPETPPMKVVEEYNRYRSSFSVRAAEAYYAAHRHEEWFRNRYDPVRMMKYRSKRINESKEAAAEIFRSIRNGTITAVLPAVGGGYIGKMGLGLGVRQSSSASTDSATITASSTTLTTITSTTSTTTRSTDSSMLRDDHRDADAALLSDVLLGSSSSNTAIVNQPNHDDDRRSGFSASSRRDDDDRFYEPTSSESSSLSSQAAGRENHFFHPSNSSSSLSAAHIAKIRNAVSQTIPVLFIPGVPAFVPQDSIIQAISSASSILARPHPDIVSATPGTIVGGAGPYSHHDHNSNNPYMGVISLVAHPTEADLERAVASAVHELTEMIMATISGEGNGDNDDNDDASSSSSSSFAKRRRAGSGVDEIGDDGSGATHHSALSRDEVISFLGYDAVSIMNRYRTAAATAAAASAVTGEQVTSPTAAVEIPSALAVKSSTALYSPQPVRMEMSDPRRLASAGHRRNVWVEYENIVDAAVARQLLRRVTIELVAEHDPINNNCEFLRIKTLQNIMRRSASATSTNTPTTTTDVALSTLDTLDKVADDATTMTTTTNATPSKPGPGTALLEAVTLDTLKLNEVVSPELPSLPRGTLLTAEWHTPTYGAGASISKFHAMNARMRAKSRGGGNQPPHDEAETAAAQAALAAQLRGYPYGKRLTCDIPSWASTSEQVATDLPRAISLAAVLDEETGLWGSVGEGKQSNEETASSSAETVVSSSLDDDLSSSYSSSSSSSAGDAQVNSTSSFANGVAPIFRGSHAAEVVRSPLYSCLYGSEGGVALNAYTPLQQLDIVLAYLRHVHCYDYYSGSQALEPGDLRQMVGDGYRRMPAPPQQQPRVLRNVAIGASPPPLPPLPPPEASSQSSPNKVVVALPQSSSSSPVTVPVEGDASSAENASGTVTASSSAITSGDDVIADLVAAVANPDEVAVNDFMYHVSADGSSSKHMDAEGNISGDASSSSSAQNAAAEGGASSTTTLSAVPLPNNTPALSAEGTVLSSHIASDRARQAAEEWGKRVALSVRTRMSIARKQIEHSRSSVWSSRVKEVENNLDSLLVFRGEVLPPLPPGPPPPPTLTTTSTNIDGTPSSSASASSSSSSSKKAHTKDNLVPVPMARNPTDMKPVCLPFIAAYAYSLSQAQHRILASIKDSLYMADLFALCVDDAANIPAVPQSESDIPPPDPARLEPKSVVDLLVASSEPDAAAATTTSSSTTVSSAAAAPRITSATRVRCLVCRKIFKAPYFATKHVANRHEDLLSTHVTAVKAMVAEAISLCLSDMWILRRNYFSDPRRPMPWHDPSTLDELRADSAAAASKLLAQGVNFASYAMLMGPGAAAAGLDPLPGAAGGGAGGGHFPFFPPLPLAHNMPMMPHFPGIPTPFGILPAPFGMLPPGMPYAAAIQAMFGGVPGAHGSRKGPTGSLLASAAGLGGAMMMMAAGAAANANQLNGPPVPPFGLLPFMGASVGRMPGGGGGGNNTNRSHQHRSGGMPREMAGVSSSAATSSASSSPNTASIASGGPMVRSSSSSSSHAVASGSGGGAPQIVYRDRDAPRGAAAVVASLPKPDYGSAMVSYDDI